MQPALDVDHADARTAYTKNTKTNRYSEASIPETTKPARGWLFSGQYFSRCNYAVFRCASKPNPQ
jgi:hypothetical protein